MLKILLLGCAFSMLTIAMHALGTSVGIKLLRQVQVKSSSVTKLTLGRMIVSLCCIGAYLLLLSVAEVVAWAICYLLVPGTPELATFEDAVYFSIVTFSSLGFGDLVIASRYRLLSGIEAMNGLLIFGWSTALFATVFQRLWAAYDEPSEEKD